MNAPFVELSEKHTFTFVYSVNSKLKTPSKIVVHTPFSDDQVDSLARYQLATDKDHYVCGNPDHGVDKPLLIPTRGGFTCIVKLPTAHGQQPYEDCFYLQQWVYAHSLTM